MRKIVGKTSHKLDKIKGYDGKIKVGVRGVLQYVPNAFVRYMIGEIEYETKFDAENSTTYTYFIFDEYEPESDMLFIPDDSLQYDIIENVQLINTQIQRNFFSVFESFMKISTMQSVPVSEKYPIGYL